MLVPRKGLVHLAEARDPSHYVDCLGVGNAPEDDGSKLFAVFERAAGITLHSAAHRRFGVKLLVLENCGRSFIKQAWTAGCTESKDFIQATASAMLLAQLQRGKASRTGPTGETCRESSLLHSTSIEEWPAVSALEHRHGRKNAAL